MKWVVLVISLAAIAAAAKIDIDWSKVRPAWQMSPHWLHHSASNNPGARIVNGWVADPGQFPYQAVVLSRFPQGPGLCGGSIVSDKCILTAAHCVEQVDGGSIILGAHNRTDQSEPSQVVLDFTSDEISVHPAWNTTLIRNDLAVICLKTSFNFNDRIQKIKLPPFNGGNFAGETGIVSGFGVFSDAIRDPSDVLRFVNNTIISNTLCNIRFLGLIQSEHICLSGDNNRGACRGDSGGPLTVLQNNKPIQVGIVSFGIALGCELRWPSVFARTSSYLPWIYEKINGT